MKTVTVVGGNIHFHNSSWLHRGIIDQSTCTLCRSHQKWHCAFTQRSTEWWDHSSSHITIALDLWPQYVPRSKPPFPFCFWLLANPRSWFVAGSPLVLCSVWRGVLFHFDYWRFWGETDLSQWLHTLGSSGLSVDAGAIKPSRMSHSRDWGETPPAPIVLVPPSWEKQRDTERKISPSNAAELCTWITPWLLLLK